MALDKVVSWFKDGEVLTKNLSGLELFLLLVQQNWWHPSANGCDWPKTQKFWIKIPRQNITLQTNNWRLTFSLPLGASFCYPHRHAEILSCSRSFTHFAISGYKPTGSSRSQWENFLCKSDKELSIRPCETSPAPREPFPTALENADYGCH